MTDAMQEPWGTPQVGGTPFAGRCAVVTGASSDIGRAIARALVAGGARVGLAARRAERLEELGRSGGEALAVLTDVTDYGQAEAMVCCAEEALGGVDVFVNVAGVMLPAPIAEAEPADWCRMVEVNLVGVLHATRAALPGMIQRGNGYVVNVSSTSGRTHQPLFSVYAATKLGLGAFNGGPAQGGASQMHPRHALRAGANRVRSSAPTSTPRS